MHQGQTQSGEFAHMAVISCPMYLAEVHFHLKSNKNKTNYCPQVRTVINTAAHYY